MRNNLVVTYDTVGMLSYRKQKSARTTARNNMRTHAAYLVPDAIVDRMRDIRLQRGTGPSRAYIAAYIAAQQLAETRGLRAACSRTPLRAACRKFVATGAAHAVALGILYWPLPVPFFAAAFVFACASVLALSVAAFVDAGNGL